MKMRSELPAIHPPHSQSSRRVTGTDLVYERIKSSIIYGALQPDELLNEIALAQDLNISRTPLRHALQRLEAEGWISRSQNGRVRVFGVSEEELRALYAVRQALEDIAVIAASAALTREKLKHLKAILTQQKQASEAGDLDRATDLAEMFHLQLWAASQNNICQEFLKKVYERTTRYRRLAFGNSTLLAKGGAQHRAIVRFLERGDLASARERLRKHIETSCAHSIAAFRRWKGTLSPKESTGGREAKNAHLGGEHRAEHE